MDRTKVVRAKLFESETSQTPVRDWLLGLSKDDRTDIGQAVAMVEYRWPLGMPTCRQIKGVKGLWEVRAKLKGGRIARVFFSFDGSNMVLLHGFEKKSQKTPHKEIDLATKRMKGTT